MRLKYLYLIDSAFLFNHLFDETTAKVSKIDSILLPSSDVLPLNG